MKNEERVKIIPKVLRRQRRGKRQDEDKRQCRGRWWWDHEMHLHLINFTVQLVAKVQGKMILCSVPTTTFETPTRRW